VSAEHPIKKRERPTFADDWRAWLEDQIRDDPFPAPPKFIPGREAQLRLVRRGRRRKGRS
jgi:hypothetical protein